MSKDKAVEGIPVEVSKIAEDHKLSRQNNKMAARISTDMVKTYSGDGDIVAWLEKAKLVASLSGITDLHSFLPLFLEGNALSIYLEMSDDDKKSASLIESRLKEVYSDSKFVSFSL